MELLTGGWINATLGLSSMALLAHRSRLGWWLGIANDLVWIATGLLAGVPGASVSAVITGGVKVYGLLRWRKR